MALARPALLLVALVWGCSPATPAASSAPPPAPEPSSISPAAQANETPPLQIGADVHVGPGVVVNSGGLGSDALERKVVLAFRTCLGRGEPGKEPLAASAAILALRASPVKLRLDTLKLPTGQVLDPNMLQLHDSYTDRVPVLQRKILEKTATAEEAAEYQDGMQYLYKITDLSRAISAMSGAASEANRAAHDLARRNADDARVVGARAATDADNARDRAKIAEQKRAYAMVAATTSMVAAFEATVNRSKDPKALDVIAESALSMFPLQIAVANTETLGDAKRNNAPNPGAALARGDTKGELDAAIALLPPSSPLRAGLATAQRLLAR